MVDVLTSSDNRTRAGTTAPPPPSRIPSIPSNTKTNRNLCSSPVSFPRNGYLSIFINSTVTWLRESHLLAGGPSHSNAPATAPTICSNRCRGVMHCMQLTMACRIVHAGSVSSSVPRVPGAVSASENSLRRRPVIAVFPVAEEPYTMRFWNPTAAGYTDCEYPPWRRTRETDIREEGSRGRVFAARGRETRYIMSRL